MTKLILTDIDETILQFADPFQSWVEQRGFSPKVRLRDMYLVEEWLGIDQAEATRLLTEFGQTEVMRNQPAEPDALVVLPQLHAAGYNFIGITACGRDSRFAAQRMQTLERVFGFPFSALHCVDHKETKTEILAYYRPAIWVEDNFGHACAGADLGHDTFLITRSYNSKDVPPAGVQRVNNWYEILHSIAPSRKPFVELSTIRNPTMFQWNDMCYRIRLSDNVLHFLDDHRMRIDVVFTHVDRDDYAVLKFETNSDRALFANHWAL